jgi:glycogen debranching enzyme
VTQAVAHPLEILFGGGAALTCGLDGELHADQLHGLFAGDTRVLSTYRLSVGGHPWQTLSRSRPDPSTAQWDLQNPELRVAGQELPEGTIHLRVRREVNGGLRDQLRVTSYHDRPVAIRLAVQIDADFADLFEVKDGTVPPRLSAGREIDGGEIRFSYRHGGFARGLRVRFAAPGPPPTFVGSQVVFDVHLAPQEPWCCTIDAVPELDGHPVDAGHDGVVLAPAAARPGISADPLLAAPFRRAVDDLDRLMLDDGDGHGGGFAAAGAPWFFTLFGRDALVTALMAGLAGDGHVRGALAALARTQAHRRDDYRDAEPGKIVHEVRHGELAYSGRIPHSPYYGTHDAPELFVLALWHAYRFTGDRGLLDRYLPAATAALAWCDELGDLDGDGLLEYRTHSRRGYRNQGWKDSGDAIVDEDGRLAEPPVATVELQGYWYAARLAMAEMAEAVGQVDEAATQRVAAATLRIRVEEQYWLEEAGTYALALDADKRPIRSVSSNPGHLLWCGLPAPERAARLAERLLEPDLFSGWGLRTLAASHRCFNPLSYQRGSVWPHDGALAAAGLLRYRLRVPAARILGGLLHAAARFEDARLPELFCGFPREAGPPVPYPRANVPQAWSAAVPLLVAQLLLGLVADAPRGQLWLDPWLPPWLPALELRNLRIGDGLLSVRLRRGRAGAIIDRAEHPSLRIERGAPAAPLWGAPH